MKIVVKTYKNKISAASEMFFQLDVDDSCTTEKIKADIQTKTTIAIDKQSLFIKGKPIEDGTRISNYQIKKDSILHMVYQGTL